MWTFLLFLFVSLRCDKMKVQRQLVPNIPQSIQARKKTDGRKFLVAPGFEI